MPRRRMFGWLLFGKGNVKQGLASRPQFFGAADELYIRYVEGGVLRILGQNDKEFSDGSSWHNARQFDCAHGVCRVADLVKRAAIARRTLLQSGQAVTRLLFLEATRGLSLERKKSELVHADRGLFFALVFIDLSQMVAYNAVLRDRPSGIQVFLSLLQIPHTKIYPSERVPIGGEAWSVAEVLGLQICSIDILRGGFFVGDGLLGVLKGYWQVFVCFR